MKSSGQIKDEVIGNLLRAYVSRPSNPHQACPDFDPDQANAYIERGLTGSARTRYEQHLSECWPCRKSVVALMRLAEADSPAISAVRETAAPATSWLDGVRRALGALAQPRWAMAGAAIIVAAISLPLIFSRSENRESTNPAVGQVASTSAAPSEAPATAEEARKQGDVAALVATARTPRDGSNTERTQQVAENRLAPKPATGAVELAAAPAELLSKTQDAKSASESEAQSKSGTQVAAAPPAAAPGSQGARSDSDQNRQQQPSKDAVGQSDAKTVARAEDRAKEKNERAEDVVAPPAPRASSEEDRSRSGFGRASKLALRDSTAEAVKPEERKFSGKRFLFRDGAWTDKDFDPNKDLPIVTIIRDSNVYNEVLNKRPGLKPFLTGFHASERAIIVYKGTVYKLIPQ